MHEHAIRKRGGEERKPVASSLPPDADVRSVRGRMLALQRAAGNRAVSSVLGRPRASTVVQISRTLTIDSQDFDWESQFRAARKTRINAMISEEAAMRNVAPVSIRAQLKEWAEDNAPHPFATMREAIGAAAVAVEVKAAHPAAALDVIRFSAAEHALWSTMKGMAIFDRFPLHQAWKLLMDGKHHAGRGKFGFENERGYMGAMMTAFGKMLRELGTRLTAGYYEELHDACLRGVDDRHGRAMELGYRDSSQYGEGFGVADPDTWSLGGYTELVAKHRSWREDVVDPRYGVNPVGEVLVDPPSRMVGPTIADKVIRLRPLTADRSQGFAQSVLDLYYREAEQLEQEGGDDDARITVIARCCQDLDQLHLFVDGNIRTIAFVVMNKLLIENRLAPAILDEPNMFDCRSVQELVAAIKVGQAQFRSLAQ